MGTRPSVEMSPLCSCRLLALLIALVSVEGHRRHSKAEELLEKGQQFYSIDVSYSDLRVPNLTDTQLTFFDFHQFNDFSLHGLRFDFPFFGHPRRYIVFTLHGFITPHWVRCKSKADKLCLPETLFRISHIAPLSGEWHADLDSATTISVHEDIGGHFAHFTWYETHTDVRVCNVTQVRGVNFSEAFINQSRLSHKHCQDSPNTTFSVTLYRDGRIVFNYEKLGKKADYGMFGATHKFQGGKISLSDSSVKDVNNASFSNVSFELYANVDLSSAYTDTKKPRSIVFTPKVLTHCAAARSRYACQEHDDLDHKGKECVWCATQVRNWLNVPSFCTDGDDDAFSQFSENIGCYAEKGSSVGLAIGLSLGLLTILGLAVFFTVHFAGEHLRQQFGFSRFGDATGSSAADITPHTPGTSLSKSKGSFDDINLA